MQYGEWRRGLAGRVRRWGSWTRSQRSSPLNQPPRQTEEREESLTGCSRPAPGGRLHVTLLRNRQRKSTRKRNSKTDSFTPSRASAFESTQEQADSISSRTTHTGAHQQQWERSETHQPRADPARSKQSGNAARFAGKSINTKEAAKGLKFSRGALRGGRELGLQLAHERVHKDRGVHQADAAHLPHKHRRAQNEDDRIVSMRRSTKQDTCVSRAVSVQGEPARRSAKPQRQIITQWRNNARATRARVQLSQHTNPHNAAG